MCVYQMFLSHVHACVRVHACACMLLPPCQAPSVSTIVNSCIIDPTTSSASSWGSLPVNRPILQSEGAMKITDVKINVMSFSDLVTVFLVHNRYY